MTLSALELNTLITGTILLAEDAPDLREAISEAFDDEGYEIHVAADGYEALKMFEEHQPNLAILDMRMPMMNGKDVCSVIRRTSDIPVIMFTSSDDADDVQGAIAQGATDFVLKTTGIPELIDRVEKHLEAYYASQETVPIAELEPETEEEEPEKKSNLPDFVIQGSNFEFEQGRIKTTTLIVDPDEKSRADIIAVLSRLNQNYVEAESALAAVDAMNAIDFDMVIAEWSLPDIDAFRMFSEVKDLPGYQRMSKIIMGARINPEAHRKAEFAGVGHVMRKPLDRGKLEVTVGDEVKRLLRELRAQKDD